jgi:predicted porin
MGMSADNGTISQGGTGFGRESWVGLSSSLGSVTLGRQYSPLLFVMAANDASTQAYWGSNQNAGIGFIPSWAALILGRSA